MKRNLLTKVLSFSTVALLSLSLAGAPIISAHAAYGDVSVVASIEKGAKKNPKIIRTAGGSSSKLVKGKTKKLAIAAKNGANAKNIVWESSDEDVISIKKSSTSKTKAVYIATAENTGTAVVTATLDGVGKVTFSFTVEGITIKGSSTTEYTIKKSGTKTLSATVKGKTSENIKWESSDESIVSITELSGESQKKCKVTGVGYGTATITGTMEGADGEISYTVTVQEPTIEVSSMSSNPSVKVGKSKTISATLKNYDKVDNVSWEISDSSIAEISTSGNNNQKVTIAAKNAGSAEITGTIDGTTSSVTIYLTVTE